MPEDELKQEALAAIMRLAAQLEGAGRNREAGELYAKVIAAAPDSAAAAKARKALFQMAGEYDRQGLVHNAVDLYLRLLEN